MTHREYIFEEIHKRGLQFLLRGKDREDYLKWFRKQEVRNISSEQSLVRVVKDSD